jgi:putative phosphoribosyl transferase
MTRVFADRRDAGRRLAHRLGDLSDAGGRELRPGAGVTRDDVVVLGLPRGGVPVAAEVAAALGAPLDILVVGKVGVPGHEELALAAVADDGTVVVNSQVQAATGLSDHEVDALARQHVEALAAGGRSCGPAARPSTWPSGPWWWSTTAWPPAPPCASPSRSCATGAPAR